MAKNLILDDGGVVIHPYVLDGQRGDLGNQDAAEGVGDGGVDADQREGGIVLTILVEDDAKLVAECIQIPCMVFTWVVAWEVGRGDVGDGFCADADDLWLRDKAQDGQRGANFAEGEGSKQQVGILGLLSSGQALLGSVPLLVPSLLQGMFCRCD